MNTIPSKCKYKTKMAVILGATDKRIRVSTVSCRGCVERGAISL
jgi:hypothetical protein